MILEAKISSLINSKREGNYWDFKKLPHENNANLLHDILSLANSLHKGNRYLILGVADPSKNCKIEGLTKGQANRKSQSQLIDFLRTKKFAGEIRPEIELKTLEIAGKEIDVITIFDKPYKPYYLTESYQNNGRKVNAHYIYTRISDTNTPIDKSADIIHIDKMWRERFNLDLTPFQKIKLLLMKPDEWFKDLGNKEYAYHKQFPEFRIEFHPPEAHKEVYSYFYTNPKSFIHKAVFKYHSTTLFELDYLAVDEYRLYIGYPNPKHIYTDKGNWYYYYNLSELDGIFHYFLTNGNIESTARGDITQFLFFNNDEEHQSFQKNLIENIEEVNQIKVDSIAEYAKKAMERDDFSVNPDPFFINRVKQFYDSWKINYLIHRK